MRAGLKTRIHAALEKRLPEKRLFIRSDTETRFIRLHPSTQLLIGLGITLLLTWTIIASAILMMERIGAGNFRAQAERDRILYEERLNTLSLERDTRAAEASAAQERFSAALKTVSEMQSELLSSEDRRLELETGIETVRDTLRRTIAERDAAQNTLAAYTAPQGENPLVMAKASDELASTVDLLTAALSDAAARRDNLQSNASSAIETAAELELELQLQREATNDVFMQLERALTVSVEPLERMFRNAGMNPDQMIATVRRAYSGQGGPLTPLRTDHLGQGGSRETIERANALLARLDAINHYRLAADLAPFGEPVKANHRLSSNFGPRWGRAHEGIDFAASIGTPTLATGDGVVTFAGWQSGYGRLIKIRHEFGIETRYAHLNAIHVKVGQRVSRGDRIGDIGNTGRSTGPHLHYEVRVNGTAINPMTYLRAGRDVF